MCRAICTIDYTSYLFNRYVDLKEVHGNFAAKVQFYFWLWAYIDSKKNYYMAFAEQNQEGISESLHSCAETKPMLKKYLTNYVKEIKNA